LPPEKELNLEALPNSAGEQSAHYYLEETGLVSPFDRYCLTLDMESQARGGAFGFRGCEASWSLFVCSDANIFSESYPKNSK
jgi:hypothetical protein